MAQLLAQISPQLPPQVTLRVAVKVLVQVSVQVSVQVLVQVVWVQQMLLPAHVLLLQVLLVVPMQVGCQHATGSLRSGVSSPALDRESASICTQGK